jgi:hypothetical protein
MGVKLEKNDLDNIRSAKGTPSLQTLEQTLEPNTVLIPKEVVHMTQNNEKRCLGVRCTVEGGTQDGKEVTVDNWHLTQVLDNLKENADVPNMKVDSLVGARKDASDKLLYPLRAYTGYAARGANEDVMTWVQKIRASAVKTDSTTGGVLAKPLQHYKLATA